MMYLSSAISCTLAVHVDVTGQEGENSCRSTSIFYIDATCIVRAIASFVK
jgi:hypothetical protein